MKFPPARYLLVFSVFWAGLSFSSDVFRLSQSDNPYQEFLLPSSIFNVASLDQQAYGLRLKNISIVDADGQPLPYALFKQPQPSEQPLLETTELPVYRIDNNTLSPVVVRGSSIQIQGDRIDISTAANVMQEPEKSVGYIVDLRQLRTNLDALHFDWLQHGNAVSRWQIQASLDFQQWQMLGEYDLVRASNATGELLQNTVALNLEKGKYQFLKVTPMASNTSKITRIQGIERQNGVKPQTVAEQWTVQGNRLGAKDSVSRYLHSKVMAWEFERNEFIPANRLDIDMGDRTYSGNLSVFVKQNPNDNWYPFYSGYWMNTFVGAEKKHSSAIELKNNSMRYWRVEIDRVGEDLPLALRFEWEPLLVRMIGNTKPPFTIRTQEDSTFDAQKLFHQVAGAEKRAWSKVRLDTLMPIAVNKQEAPRSYRPFIFWGALLLSVAVLGFFSLNLFKQLRVKPH